MSHAMRIAYFSPLASMHSGITDYSEELLPHLCRLAHVDAYTDDRVAAAQEVGRIYPLYGYRDFRRERYDQLVFHLENSPEHVPIYDLFVRFGGVAVLHDLELTRVIGAKTLHQGDNWGFLRAVQRNEGLGPFLRTAGEVLLRGQVPSLQQSAFEMTRLVAQRAAGIIVHSRMARQHLLGRYPEVHTSEVPMGIPQPPAIDAAEARQLLNLPQDAFICISVGRLNPEKRIHVAMQAFARLLERCPNSLYILVGEPAAGYPLLELAQTFGIVDRVRLPGYVDLATLYRYLAASDVGISLRYARRGEMSAGLLRIMSTGKPVIVPSCAPFDELPGDCVVKVDGGMGEIPQIVAALWALCNHPAMRLCYGRRAAQYVRNRHDLATAARLYVDFLEELATVETAEGILLSVACPPGAC